MTELERTQIRKLREHGMGHRTIAKYTGLQLSTVRYQANKVEIPGNAADEDLLEKIMKKEACAFCGEPIKSSWTGRKRRFCSDECRRSYWLLHDKEIKRSASATYTKICPYCGKTFTVYGARNRKYCCHDHYVRYYYGLDATFPLGKDGRVEKEAS